MLHVSAGTFCLTNPDVANQLVPWDCTNSTDDTSVCTLECAQGFTKTGDLVCLAGIWSSETCVGMEVVYLSYNRTIRLCWSVCLSETW